MQMCDGCFRPIESHKEICFECLNLLDIIDNAISGVIPASVNKIITRQFSVRNVPNCWQI